MCPDAGYVPCFELLPYADGVIINYPDNGNWQVLPPFVDQPRLNDAYQEAEEWSAMIHCNTVGKLNKIIDLGYAEKIIQVAEALHEKKLANIADILASHHELKLVLIAGPSSSGKTSTAQRLSIIKTVSIRRVRLTAAMTLNVWRLSTWSCSTIICSVCWLVKRSKCPSTISAPAAVNIAVTSCSCRKIPCWLSKASTA